MDPKLREKTKAVFRAVLKKCEDLRKADDSDNGLGSAEDAHQTTRRFDVPKHKGNG